MKRLKKVLAWIGIAILAILYLTTFVVGVFGNAHTRDLFMACVVCTVVIPVLMYAMLLLAKQLERRNDRYKDEDGV